MADWFRRSEDGVYAQLVGATQLSWPPADEVVLLIGKDGTRYNVASWHLATGWSRAEPLEYSAAELAEKRKRWGDG